MIKKILSVVILLALPVVALAQGSFVPLAPIPGLTDASALSVANSSDLASFFNNLYKFAIGIAAALAVIQIIWAGLDIAFFHKDAVSAITDDKGKIYNAVFGLVLVLSPVLVFSIINPSILNLSLNLPPLKTTSGPSTTEFPTYQSTDLQQVGKQIQETSNQNPSAQIEIPIKSGTDQEQQNISAQCKTNSNGSKITAVKGLKEGYYVCI